MHPDASQDKSVEIHAIVHGQVQGVGFRASVRQQAIRLGLRGTARNLPDGTVEIKLQGLSQHITTLFQTLRQHFHITDISQQMVTALTPFVDFAIIH